MMNPVDDPFGDMPNDFPERLWQEFDYRQTYKSVDDRWKTESWRDLDRADEFRRAALARSRALRAINAPTTPTSLPEDNPFRLCQNDVELVSLRMKLDDEVMASGSLSQVDAMRHVSRTAHARRLRRDELLVAGVISGPDPDA